MFYTSLPGAVMTYNSFINIHHKILKTAIYKIQIPGIKLLFKNISIRDAHGFFIYRRTNDDQKGST